MGDERDRMRGQSDLTWFDWCWLVGVFVFVVWLQWVSLAGLRKVLY